MHALIHTMVESRMMVVGQQAGRPGKAKSLDGLKSQLVGSVRRQVSFLAARANARLLVSRMESHVGQGAGEAAKRRQLAATMERQQVRERQAQALSLSQGRSILRRGCFWAV